MANMNDSSPNPNLGAVSLHPSSGNVQAAPAAGAFRPGLGVKPGMNANMNQAVGGAWSDLTPNLNDPSKFSGTL